jgi:hypothetical protein
LEGLNSGNKGLNMGPQCNTCADMDIHACVEGEERGGSKCLFSTTFPDWRVCGDTVG